MNIYEFVKNCSYDEKFLELVRNTYKDLPSGRIESCGFEKDGDIHTCYMCPASKRNNSNGIVCAENYNGSFTMHQFLELWIILSDSGSIRRDIEQIKSAINGLVKCSGFCNNKQGSGE